MVDQWWAARNLRVHDARRDDAMVASGDHLIDLASSPGGSAGDPGVRVLDIPVLIGQGPWSPLSASLGEVLLVFGQDAQAEGSTLLDEAQDGGVLVQGKHEQRRV